MHAKLENGLYPDRFAFETDFRLMMNNAKTYNAPGSWAHNEAVALEGFFDKRRYYLNLLLDFLIIPCLRMGTYQQNLSCSRQGCAHCTPASAVTTS